MAEYITVAKVGDIFPGEALQVEVGDTLISIWNVKGTFYAIDDICTHEEAYLSEGELIDDCCAMCPLHGSEFDLATGAAKCLPATEPVRTYPVRVEGDEVQIAVL
jgi:3-phenylpropionate/trans-cinnamate dioxygenase ferredoxin component